MTKKPLFISVPHSGEQVPQEVTWLRGLSEPILMRDVDRFVDFLYEKAIAGIQCPTVIAKYHRYVVDLNRLPSDVDQGSVIGADLLKGSFSTGLHWQQTTQGEPLMQSAMSQQLHEELVTKYFLPFHADVEKTYQHFFDLQFKKVYQIDAHSMPSMGTAVHRDPGQRRAEVVLSDAEGKSCESSFFDLAVEAYKKAGFEVVVNWPYVGGRITQTYGVPEKGQHALQVELNRALYMDESTKQILPAKAHQVQRQIQEAIGYIASQL